MDGPAPRVCLFTETYHPVTGGGETQARALADGLAALGSSMTILTRRSDPAFPRDETSAGVRIVRLSPAGKGRYKKWGLVWSGFWALLRHRDSFDVVVVSGFRILGIPVAVACGILGRPFVLKADSLGEMSGEYFAAGLKQAGLGTSSLAVRAFVAFRNTLLKRADAFVAVSSPVAEELIGCGVEGEHVVNIPNCVDLARFRPASEEEQGALRQGLKLPRDRIVVVYTGRLVSYKGLPGLLRAWCASPALKESAFLLLVGEGGLDIHNCEAELVAFVEEHGLEASVRFAGAVEDVHDYLRASDLFVFPTENEAFGISLVEAMACGLAVVSTRVGGIRDFLHHQLNGLQVEACDDEDVRMQLESLVSDADARARLGRAARETAEQRYSCHDVVDAYLRLVTTIVRGGGHVRREGGQHGT